MSTTPSISDFPDAAGNGSYSVVGKSLNRGPDRPGLSAVLLGRGPALFRRGVTEQLCRAGFDEVIAAEPAPPPYDAAALTRAYRNLKIIIFSGTPNSGFMIDAAIRESAFDYVLVLQGNMKIVSVPAISSGDEQLCRVPVFMTSKGDPLPTAAAPLPGRHFDIELQAAADLPTLIPWDYSGIYRKKSHLNIGGFDAQIAEPWWQKADYGMRAWLWGEELRVHSGLQIEYTGGISPEDSTQTEGYSRFYLKNLAVKRRGGAARFVRHRALSCSPPVPAAPVRKWVREHRHRFVRDAGELTEQWGDLG